MSRSTQMLKGILEGCILKIISKNETYGYEICEKLIEFGFKEVTEGSVYPILIRLEKKRLIHSLMKPSPLGPMRKYYYLTNEGKDELSEFITTWYNIKKNVENVLEG